MRSVFILIVSAAMLSSCGKSAEAPKKEPAPRGEKTGPAKKDRGDLARLDSRYNGIWDEPGKAVDVAINAGIDKSDALLAAVAAPDPTRGLAEALESDEARAAMFQFLVSIKTENANIDGESATVEYAGGPEGGDGKFTLAKGDDGNWRIVDVGW